PAPLSIPVVDLRDVPAAERHAETRRQLLAEAARPFNLTAGPLLRALLLRLEDTEHVLVLMMHHIISDGWSMGVLVREMGSLYAAKAMGAQPVLPPLPVQYADYATWQRQWLKDEALKERLDYWRHQLSGAPALLELPTDRPRPPVQSRRGARQSVHLPVDLTEAIKARSQRHGVTPFMTLLAAFQVLLYRYSGQDDIVVGSPIAGRTRAETEGLIGFFVNTLVLRSRILPRDSFESVLSRVKETTLGAYEHQDVPFEKLVEELKPERSLSYSPLFQVMFALQNTPMGALELPDLRVRLLELEDVPAKFDLDLGLTETPDGFMGVLQYATDLFDAPTVARMVEHLRTLLRAALAHPEQPLASLPLMDEAEQRRLLVEWNSTATDFAESGCVHERISAQATRTPDAVAAVSDSGSLTYAQLETRSDLLASHLRQLGVRPGTLVALCMERALELPVALLGILKAGGAYVPLDPSYPRERLAFMLQDTAAPVLLTQQHLRGLLPDGPKVVCLDSDWEHGSGPNGPDVPVPPESAAYVIYTSGSTGQPKGTVISHRALANHMAWLVSTFGLSSSDRVLLKTPLSFDASVWECWASLLVGAPLVLAPPEAHRDPAALVACVVRQRVSVLQVVPSMLRFMLEEEGLRGATHLRWLFCGGEALASELGPRLRAVLPGVRLVNLYGPTEVTIDSTFAEASGEESGLTVPIGKPVANTRAYVLDARMQPVPTGVPGELYLGGVQLAHGYLQRPHLTAERFVPDALSGEAGARLYRTGDKVRWKSDGTLEYLGRIDFQVKLRGQRIELGEIEAALKQQPGVRDATVLVREDVPGNQRLVGYVVPTSGHPLDPAALRSGLLRHLPEYMVPSAFVFLEVLPLTPNGKLDRKALPPPDASNPSGGFQAPRLPTEQQLANIMAALLRVERVGVDDSFFALGGHSLLATQLVSRIRATFGVELPLRAVFESPTLSGLSQRISALQGGGAAGHPAPLLQSTPRSQALPLSFAQQRLWFIDQLDPGSVAYNLPAAVRLSGTLDVSALERALQALVARHESLRTTFATQDGEAVQRIHEASASPLPRVDLSTLPPEQREAEARRTFSEDARRPFDLARGPLLRTTLLRLEETEHVLLLTMHHIISDGWSTGVLVRELGAFYQAEVSGTPASLPALPVQYAGYAAWQRDWLRGEVLDTQLGYWKRQLAGAPSLLELPTDRPRPATQNFRGANVPVVLSRQLSDELLAASQKHGVTPFMLLLAGFQALLHRYSGQDDIVVGSPIAGRTRAETEGLIGFFVNTLVLRARIAPRASFLSLLQQVRETTLGAYERQEVPFEKLVEELKPERSLSYTPLFQVMFTLQNTPTGTLELPGLRVRSVEPEDVPAKFDLNLTLAETPDGFMGVLQYATDLFDAPTVARMVEHLRTLLRSAVARPELPVASLPLMDEAEQHRLLVEWNDTAVTFSEGGCVHERISAQAARTPDAVAAVSDSGSLTYAQLEARSDLLASHLRQLGVRPGTLVALCMERSLELPVALLAILKAGGAYVPLDPAYPRERLAFMLQDTAAPVLLTQQHLRGLLPDGPIVVCLDAGGNVMGGAEASGPSVQVSPHSAAYVIYTSGSTGQPKGTVISHRALANHMAWLVSTFSLSSSDRVLLKTPLSFDASVWECWAPLLVGAPLVLAPPEAHRDPAALLACVVRQRVTVLQVVPSMLRFMLEEGYLRRATHLRWLFCGGEALASELGPRLRAVLPEVRLVNLYGPTEVTIDSTFAEASGPESGLTVPIGRPVANTRAYVLDARMQPVPTGVPGELYLGGVQLAHGYLNRPHLTAERFVPDALSGEAGARLYRTGDKVRWLDDGTLEYLGRIDFQVKLRGQRIELGEIEAALKQQPGVRDATVLVREDVPGNQRLVGYVVPVAEGSRETEALRSGLLRHLPEYMVPSTFVFLEALPLTPNGKLDRKALPPPEAGGDSFVAPSTPVQRQLASLWSDLLHAERVGIHDSFFSLGGHSLLATQLVSRVRTAFGVELPLRAVFESPTLSGLSQRISALQGGGAAGHQAPPLLPAPRTGPLPLSFAQQRLWFIDQLDPGSVAYNLPAAVRLSGTLDVSALERALQALIARHESLRTTFATQDGEAVQRIHEPASSPLPQVDLSTLPPEQREAEARRTFSEDSRRPFDLVRGPLLRTTLLRLEETEHVLLLTMHHIISDGWSTGVLVHELAAFYQAEVSGTPASLPALPVQYADYAAWQRGWLRGEVLDAQLGYWKRQLSGAPPLLELPTDRPRPATQTFRGANVPVVLSHDLSEAVLAMCQRHGVTPFMLLLTAFQALLHRYSGQDDIVVGSPIAGRTRAETEGLIGFFVNTLVLRARVTPRASFLSLLQQVRETTLGAYEHQEVPFEKLVEELKPERSLSYSPLFQVMFALQNTPRGALEMRGLSLRSLAPEDSPAKFDLDLGLAQTPEGFAGVLQYSTALFDAATATRMVEHLLTLLRAALAHPEQPLASLPLMDEAEQRRLLGEWNATVAPFPADASVHDLFSAQASRTPEALAAVSDSGSLTYAELETRSGLLASHLRQLGVRPGTLVALCMERSLELPVALLAILKAGGAYVPLDPAYPRERLAFMLQDTAAPILLTQQHLRGLLPEGPAVVCLDSGWETGHIPSGPGVSVPPESAAYVIYTSGSTGQPKGTVISHRALANHSEWMRTTYALGSGERTLQLTPLSFDVSVAEFFAALLSGAAVVLAPADAQRNPALLLTCLLRHRITVLQVVPSLLRVLLDEPALRTVQSLRWLISGGEALPADLPPRVREAMPHVRLSNNYGPTETTIDATWWWVQDVLAGPATSIGRPVANTRAYVLDAGMRPVPTGVPGELYLGGVGLAHGYLNRPHLTAERFVPDALSGEAGARLYRTGDKVRWKADGTLEYLGRIDFQVKLRGQRIELGEIEAALKQQPGVHDATVLVREDVPGNQRLVGYVVPADEGSLNAGTLRVRLQKQLPEYMVPSTFVFLEALPLTPNGKLDRKALPLPDAGSGESFVAPSTPVQQQLASLWSDLLRVERVGADDSFFTLGGHSLLATQLVSRVRTAFSVELPLRAVFESPTLSGLAQRISALQGAGAPRHEAPPLLPAPRTGPLPLSFAQQRLWFIDQLEPGSAAYNLPAAVRLSGTLDVTALERALQALVARHESLRTTFATQDGEAVQRIHEASASPLPQVDLSTLPVEQREAGARRLATTEAAEPFDLVRGPLLRATLLRLEETEHVLLLTMHHIVSDGWSMSVLVRELAALYEAALSGEAPRLAPLPVQYADYAVWQRDWLRGEVLEEWLGYWKQQLSGAPHALELPTDRPRPPVQTFNGAAHSFTFPRELSEQLEALAHEHHATLFMVLLAAWQTLLHRYSGQEDIVVGSPIAGRNRAETEGLIGFFVNTLALRSRLSGEDTFVSLLERVRETTLGAYAHQEVPFEKLVEVLQPRRDLSRSPFFQVMFALQNVPDSELRLSGLKLSAMDAAIGTAKFELTLAMTATAHGLAGTLEYNTDLFNASTAARLVEHLRTLLGAIAVSPRQKLSALPLMNAAEQRQVLGEWSARASDFPREATLPGVFAQVVERFPDHIAVEFGDAKLTYRQLDERANRLAWHLRRLGVGADTCVALAVERSLELIVSLVAILKAGGAYVPLDPSYPRERLDGMVEDTAPRVLITTRALLEKRPAGLTTLVLEDASLDSGPAHAPPSTALPDSLAYVDFTSGSTGRPKGVGTTHRNVLRTLFGIDYAHLGPDETLLQLAPIAFDASTLEVWGALLHGARLVVMPPQPPSLEELGQVLRDARVTTLWLTAGLFTQMVEGHLEGLRPVKQVLAGGDVVPASHVRRVLEELRIPVTNGYGPTETTVFAACHRMTDPASLDASVPIGRPIGGTRLYVLDAHGQPVPAGVPGELFIGGDGLARGYIGQPALTAERFIPDAFSGIPGARLYRSGDLVRWLDDGTLDFIGRVDSQVKLRGFRIELGEVQAALDSHPEVQGAVAVLREDRPGDKRLVGYVVAPESLDMATLRAFLQQRLPEYMVPSALVRLDALPLTPNGKVDRKALPAPELTPSRAGYVAPRTPTEERLAALWAETLGLERVGAEDDFFELGGHSLLAARLTSRLQKALGRRVSLATLFQHPTVAALATVLDARPEEAAAASHLVRLKQGQPGRPSLFLVHGGGGGVDAYADLARLLPADQPVHAFRAPGLDGGAPPPASVEALAALYLPQLRAAQPRGPYLLGGWSFGGLVAQELARRLQAEGDTVALLVMLDSHAPGERAAPAPDVLGQLATFGELLDLPWRSLPLDVAELTQLGERERLAWLLEQLRRLPAGAPDLDLDEAERRFRVFQRLSEAQRTHVPGRSTGPTVLLKATPGADEPT
ncbi:non-ribosomal peptide synthase/polyketide synthase, partial [Pyxidicoccus fallax]|uniref:non-ribosomal peptide synthetase n=1 Tax=Pyxidicoccus fallax TaxID=394095 RepID=UPI0014942645